MATYKVRVRATTGRVKVNRGAVAAFIRSDPKLQRDMSRRADNMIQGWRSDVPPGELSSTFRVRPGTRSGPGVTAIAGVEGRTPQLGYYWLGTRRHVIVPRVKKALRFVRSGAVTFAKKVNHPGNRAHPFIERNLHRAAD